MPQWAINLVGLRLFQLEIYMLNRTLIALFALIAFSASAAFAKDAEFDAYWTKFKAALQKNDKEAIASMTRLPYNSYEKPMDRKQFIVYCNQIFSKKKRDALLKQTPVKDKTAWMVFVNDDIYIFEKVKGAYLFTEIGVND
ncbi:MAG: hypothetical protein DKT66_25875 [Candidatus Melainabacteria bacterium]|nr:MAG: hypothetical protein DKT66_25875 [Candidatus Melainabacteria bacterium]